MNITLNSSEYLTNRMGAELPTITATVRDVGTFEALYFAFAIWALSVVIHELGHWFYMLKHKPDSKIIISRAGVGIRLQTGVEDDYKTLTADQRIGLYLTGIIAGLIPILIAGAIHPIYYLILPAYIVGTYRDMQLIYYVWRNEIYKQKNGEK